MERLSRHDAKTFALERNLNPFMKTPQLKIFHCFLLALLLFACATTSAQKDAAVKPDPAKELFLAGRTLFQEGKPKEALVKFEDSLKICETDSIKSCMADNLYLMGLSHATLADPEQAPAFLQRAEGLYKESGNEAALAAALNALGKIYVDRNEFAIALQYFNQSLEIDNRINNSSGAAGTYNNIGKIYYKRGDYAKALDYYNKALDFFVSTGNAGRSKVVLLNIRMAEKEMLEREGNKEAGAKEGPSLDKEESVAKPLEAGRQEDQVSEVPTNVEKKENIQHVEITILANLLNLYQAPSAGSMVVARVLKGGAYKTLDYVHDEKSRESFFRIQLKNGKTGWIRERENKGGN